MEFKKNWLLIFLVLAALSLRLVGIKLGLPSETGGLTTLHSDESVTFYTLEKMNPSKLDFYPGSDALSWGTFHLYAVGALIKTLDLTGVVKLGNRQQLKENLAEVDKMYLAARLFSVLFGVLSVVALYFIGSLFLDERAAMFSAVLMALAQAPVMSSYLVKTDGTMIFWALVSVYFSFKLLRNPSARNYSLAGFFLGLAFITKYSAVLLAFFPLAAHFYHAHKAHNPVFGFKKLAFFLLCGLAAFLICNPYFLIRPVDELDQIFTNVARAKMSADAFKSVGLYAAYISVVLPAAIGFFLVPFALVAVARWISGPASEKRIVAVYCILFIVWAGANPSTYILYTLPVAPFLFLAAGDLAHSIFGRRWGRVLVIAVFAQALFYTVYVKRNYISDYTIKRADSWLRENLPADATVAIPKSDTWTPYVIRRHAGSFKVLEGASSQTIQSQAVAKLGAIYSNAEYVVISEPEYVPVEEAREKDPAAYAALQNIYSGTKEIVRFEKRLPFYVLPFNSGKVPQQVNFMNPEIRILKVIKA